MLYDENAGLIRASDGGFDSPAEVGVEYMSPEQKSGIHGTIYRQFFTTSLPAGLTSGDNVSKLIDYGISYHDTTNRAVARGDANYGTPLARIQLSGTAGNGNLVLEAGTPWVIIEGWVDYTK